MVHSIVLHGPEGTETGAVVAENVLGRLAFAANDPDGSYGRAVTAKIEAKAEEEFDTDDNQTKLVFFLAGEADSGAATAKMTLSSAGNLTLVGNLLIPNGGNIGSAGDPDAIAISTAGVVTMDQIPVFSAGINVTGGTIAGTLADGVVATTQSSSDNSTKVATTAYADAAGGGSGASLTGDTDNTVVTVTGSDAIAGEARLTFDGDALAVTTSDQNKVPVTINGAASQASDLLQLKNSDGDTLFIVDAIGQVGIGDSVDPASGKLLHISGGTTDGNKVMIFEAGSTGGGDTNNQAILKLVAGTSANVQIQMGHGTGSSTLKGGIKYKSDDSLVLRTNSADALTIDSSQAVTFSKATKPALKSNTDGSTVAFDLDVANVHTVTLGDGNGAGNRTFSITNEDAGQKFIIRMLQDGTGSRTVTWFSTIKWAGGSAPTLTTTPDKADVVGFIVTGTDTYDGFVVGQNI